MISNRKLQDDTVLCQHIKKVLFSIQHKYIDTSELEETLEKEIDKVSELPINEAMAVIANKALSMNLCWNGIHDFLMDTFDATREEVDLALIDYGDENVCLALSRDSSTTPEALNILSKSDSKLVLNSVAGHASAKKETLTELASSPHEEVRACVASNTNTPENILAHLARDENLYVVKALATNPSLNDEQISQLESHADDGVKQCLSRNPSCPITVLKRLAMDNAPNILCRLASRKDLESEELHKICENDSLPRVLHRVLNNPAIDGKILQKLSMHKDKSISFRASEILEQRT